MANTYSNLFSFISVMLGGFGTESGTAATASSEPQGEVRSIDANGAADLVQNAKKIIIVPGYGLAVAQAQHVLAEVVKLLTANNAILASKKFDYSKSK